MGFLFLFLVIVVIAALVMFSEPRGH